MDPMIRPGSGQESGSGYNLLRSSRFRERCFCWLIMKKRPQNTGDGASGCVMYSKRTVFDLILPRVLAGDLIDDRCYK